MSIYEEIGMQRLVNARSIVGRFGDSLMSQAVIDAMNDAAKSHVYMADLRQNIHRQLAELTDNEAAMVCSGAACGGMLAVAACMTGLDEDKKNRLPNTDSMRNEVIMHKKGRWPEDVSIRPTGVTIREIGGSSRKAMKSELEQTITDRTAAILMCSFDKKTVIPLDLAVAMGKDHGVPVIIDGAYTIPPKENLWYFTKEMGADLAIFSGGKALRGPASTGLVVGRKDLIEACELNNRYNQGIGFSCKVGKEELVGIFVAIRNLVKRDEEAITKGFLSRIENLKRQLTIFPFLRFETTEHGFWGDDFGLHIFFEDGRESVKDIVVGACRNQNPPIEVGVRRDHVYICLSVLNPADDDLVASRLLDAINKAM